jgi:hypothetical protein
VIDHDSRTGFAFCQHRYAQSELDHWLENEWTDGQLPCRLCGEMDQLPAEIIQLIVQTAVAVEEPKKRWPRVRELKQVRKDWRLFLERYEAACYMTAANVFSSLLLDGIERIKASKRSDGVTKAILYLFEVDLFDVETGKLVRTTTTDNDGNIGWGYMNRETTVKSWTSTNRDVCLFHQIQYNIVMRRDPTILFDTVPEGTRILIPDQGNGNAAYYVQVEPDVPMNEATGTFPPPVAVPAYFPRFVDIDWLHVASCPKLEEDGKTVTDQWWLEFDSVMGTILAEWPRLFRERLDRQVSRRLFDIDDDTQFQRFIRHLKKQREKRGREGDDDDDDVDGGGKAKQ